MKIVFFLLMIFNVCYSQDFYGVTKKNQWEGNNVISNNSGNKYSDVWGIKIEDKDYAIIGSTLGTHIIDVSDADNIGELFFIEGKERGAKVAHRDYHDYKGYLYAVCDEGSSSLQIINLNNLPSSIDVVYDSDTLFSKAHNVFIDSATAKLYVCGGENKFSIYSITNPEKPSLLTICYLDYSWWSSAVAPSRNGGVHDVFVKNDTAYCHTYDGMYIIDFTNYLQPIVLASYTSYPDQGLNHSGWLQKGTNIYFTTDETQGKKIKILNVSNPQDIEFIDTVGSNVNSASIAHNSIVMGNYLYVSYYHDGLRVFNIKDPKNAYQVGFYSTSTSKAYNEYKGAWGVYPFLGQHKILVSDMQNGLFVLDASGIENPMIGKNIQVYPNPFEQSIVISDLPKSLKEFQISVSNLNGIELYSVKIQNNFMRRINITLPISLTKGVYILNVKNKDYSRSIKLIKS
jgi:choice-of-anchor B domain-containing protein